jgi:hypothetical protein
MNRHRIPMSGEVVVDVVDWFMYDPNLITQS